MKVEKGFPGVENSKTNHLRSKIPVYAHVLEYLKRNHGRKLREVMDAEIDISDMIQ
jgi:hypothetical protein